MHYAAILVPSCQHGARYANGKENEEIACRQDQCFQRGEICHMCFYPERRVDYHASRQKFRAWCRSLQEAHAGCPTQSPTPTPEVTARAKAVLPCCGPGWPTTSLWLRNAAPAGCSPHEEGPEAASPLEFLKKGICSWTLLELGQASERAREASIVVHSHLVALVVGALVIVLVLRIRPADQCTREHLGITACRGRGRGRGRLRSLGLCMHTIGEVVIMDDRMASASMQLCKHAPHITGALTARYAGQGLGVITELAATHLRFCS
jgi:hypothetical protein